MAVSQIDYGAASNLAPILRVAIENVRPQIDAGRFAIKRVVGEEVEVTADIHADGHNVLRAIVLDRPAGHQDWRETEMEALGNDGWRARFQVNALGQHFYTVRAWIDPYFSWLHDLERKIEGEQDVSVDLLVGAGLLEAAAGRTHGADHDRLSFLSREVRGHARQNAAAAAAVVTGNEARELMRRHSDRSLATTYHRELQIIVDRPRARFGAWYEMFPRSAASAPGKHGTFKDCIRRLDYIAEMGFDVLYLPPIHPIGHSFRKGKNNRPKAEKGDVGSPWAIGGKEGGHTAIHPDLGTLDDFKKLIACAKEKGIEVALDLAFQCSPDHPYVNQHPEWFQIRPDGTVQYAENPPKKYQDIFPLNFESQHSADLCDELRRVVLFWIEQGVHIFRVDNPHTKPYAFWDWLISDLKTRHPELIFLSEAFTRPKVKYRLAKLGFTQSYTYFAWRNSKAELTQYFQELTQPPVREFCRPNLWPNTPDILTEYLQFGGRPAFMSRLVLAATLGASYGIYGPAYELCDNRPAKPGSEEYLDSEKYQLRHWDTDRPDNLRHLITRINHARRENLALQHNSGLQFHSVDNEQILAYTKSTPDLANIVLTVVNLDPHHPQSGWLELPLEKLGLDPAKPYQAHDLLSEARYLWNGPRNYVLLNPAEIPAHVFVLRRRVRTERDFDYFM